MQDQLKGLFFWSTVVNKFAPFDLLNYSRKESNFTICLNLALQQFTNKQNSSFAEASGGKLQWVQEIGTWLWFPTSQLGHIFCVGNKVTFLVQVFHTVWYKAETVSL